MKGVATRCALVLCAASGCGRLGFAPLDDLMSDGGSSGGDSGGLVDVDPTMLTHNIAFVTSTSLTIDELGGVAGADAKCAALASAAGLPGTYVAWLASAGTTATSRLGAARGWVRVDGKPVVDTVADLVAGSLLHPILLTELGQAVTGQFGILTATAEDGTVAEDCVGLTSTASGDMAMTGIASTTRTNWTENLATACNSSFRHYCFGIDRTEPLAYTPAAGRRAFVMAATWPPSGGPDTADGACQAAADARSLGGTWRALLATTTATAASRFDRNGAPWVRLDGIALASTPDALLDGMNLDAPLNLTETGVYRGSNPAITGATSTTALGASNSTCADWTSAAAGDMHRVGLLNSITLYFSTLIFQTCSSGASLYCLEP